jgi:hypothetical protein
MYTAIMAQLKVRIVFRRSICMFCIRPHIVTAVLESLTYGLTFGVPAH